MSDLITAEHFQMVAQYADLFKQGMVITILLSALTVLFGFFLALLLAIMASSTRSSFITYGMVIVAYAVMEALLSGGLLTSSLKGMLVPICAYVVMAVSLNLTVGIMLQMPTYMQDIITGAIIVLSVVAQRLGREDGR